ncbi:MAG: hypothetical protein KAI98_07280 [Gemmatimonadetes bacterium]|nr:hypothetical protein [Gemmatimonadota bacterium]
MRRPGTRLRIPLLASQLVLVSTFSSALAQESQAPCCSRFDYVLERTIFKVDAVRLELTVRGDTPDRVVRLVTGRADPRSSSDSVAALYLRADNARVRMTFLRSFGLKRFLDANRGMMEKLSRAGLLSDEELRRLDAANHERFETLAADGIRDGDVLEHEVRGDTVTTRYTDVSGAVRVDEVRVGSEQRRVLMGSLFGPESGFRKGLLDLVFSRAEAESPGK